MYQSELFINGPIIIVLYLFSIINKVNILVFKYFDFFSIYLKTIMTPIGNDLGLQYEYVRSLNVIGKDCLLNR